MSRKRYSMKVGPEFLELRNHLKTNIEFNITDQDITDDIARFIKDRGIHDMMVRRANIKHRKGWF